MLADTAVIGRADRIQSFFSREFFMNRQKTIIAEAYEEIKNGYDDELDAINGIAENLQDTYGVKTVIFKQDEIIYSSGYSFMMQGQRPKMNPMLQHAEFTIHPTVNLIEGKAILGDAERLQLAGKFYADSDEVNVLLTLPIASIDNSISVFTESNIYISLAVLSIGIIIAMIVAKNISKPITDIEAVSKKIAALDFSYVADENCSSAELASLAKSINQMSEQLSFNMQQLTKANEQLQKDIEYRKQIEHYRREFIAGVSHEMKTPLALLQIYTENLKSNISGIDKDYYCDTIVEETENLSRMVSDMLEISSVDSGFITLNSEEIDVAELCRNILKEYQLVLGEYQTIADLPQNAVVSGDRKYLEQVIKNLLNNAAEHSEIGNEIAINLRCDKQVILEITNEGEHIPEEHLEHIWDAFYRTDKARTQNENNNVGLGLYIVKTVIDKMGGSCKIRNTDNGVAVTIILNSR